MTPVHLHAVKREARLLQSFPSFTEQIVLSSLEMCASLEFFMLMWQECVRSFQ